MLCGTATKLAFRFCFEFLLTSLHDGLQSVRGNEPFPPLGCSWSWDLSQQQNKARRGTWVWSSSDDATTWPGYRSWSYKMWCFSCRHLVLHLPFFSIQYPCLTLLHCMMEDSKFIFLFNMGSQLRDFLESHMRFFFSTVLGPVRLWGFLKLNWVHFIL